MTDTTQVQALMGVYAAQELLLEVRDLQAEIKRLREALSALGMADGGLVLDEVSDA